jgi:hypothetical protein
MWQVRAVYQLGCLSHHKGTLLLAVSSSLEKVRLFLHLVMRFKDWCVSTRQQFLSVNLPISQLGARMDTLISLAAYGP